MTKVFIDGKSGTTGLRIYERLSERNDIELITLSDEKRKDISARKNALNSCDIAFLCLPDDAARDAVSMVKNDKVKIIDTSTAHRTEKGWTYGFPELDNCFYESIKVSKRIANPGCHASGFIALIYPLVTNNILSKDALLCCHSITGYSGGGKKMISEYESEGRSVVFDAPRQYGISQNHKHLKEMKTICCLENEPVFSPIVSDFYSGMLMTVQLFKSQLNNHYTADDIKKTYKEKYKDGAVLYKENADCNGFINSNTLSGSDGMTVSVCGNNDRILLTACYDNLGKGASGAAIESMNIMIGSDRFKGLDLKGTY